MNGTTEPYPVWHNKGAKKEHQVRNGTKLVYKYNVEFCRQQNHVVEKQLIIWACNRIYEVQKADTRENTQSDLVFV